MIDIYSGVDDIDVFFFSSSYYWMGTCRIIEYGMLHVFYDNKCRGMEGESDISISRCKSD
jgi:hypothetical protein